MSEGPDEHGVPVIAIDGPTASGKGAVAARVADALGWHYLDSGALYRITALLALRAGLADTDADSLGRLAGELAVEFDDSRIIHRGEDLADAIRATAVGAMASRIAAHPVVRTGLLARQLAFRRPPGLVADGRDMGTVVFPDAPLKVFLTASVEARAVRRHKQLIEKGFSAKLDGLLADLRERDRRDSTRAAAPLRAAEGAVTIDSTDMALDEVVRMVLEHARRRGFSRGPAR